MSVDIFKDFINSSDFNNVIYNEYDFAEIEKNKTEIRSILNKKHVTESELAKAKTKKWYESHITEVLAYNGKRRSLKVSATPPWLTAIHEAQIQEMYDVARAKTVQTGIEHHVDHIHPLKGSGFNGLHVPWNLQVIPAFDNLSKKNKMPIEYQHMLWSL
jgi:hypothetical protein